MDKEQNIAYINAQIACAMIKAMGMTAENKQREILGQSMAYSADMFFDLIEEHGLGHNSIITQLFN